MNYTKGEWKAITTYKENGAQYVICDGKVLASVKTKVNDNNLIAAAPDMYEALKYSDELIKIARQYFPKSIKTSDKFTLENTCATIGKALAKAEGK